MTGRVSVGLGERAYPVLIGPGLLDESGRHVAPVLKRPRLTVVADAAVAALHGSRLQAGLERGGVEADLIRVPPGEASKSFAQLERVIDALLVRRLDRNDTLAAFGGGVVGDLAGFAAAIYKRGVPFIQIPTTLLAQVDSSVGGKTAIDTPRGKNLVGAFHQPRLVLADTDVLTTLPPRELRAGMAEVIKAALITDAGFFAWLEAQANQVLALDPGPLAEAITRAVAIKAAIVAEDEHETTGRRALLNLGHTFAHALETEAGFGTGALLHGEAVALGCALAFRLSAAQGLCPAGDVRRMEQVLAAAGVPTHLRDLDAPLAAHALLAHMAQDKKAEAGVLTLILARRIGEVFAARDVNPATLRDFLISEGALP
jgi:3-dehydroquinate synthase